MVLISFRRYRSRWHDTQGGSARAVADGRGFPRARDKVPNRESSTGMLINDALQRRVRLSSECLRLLFVANMWEDIELLRPTDEIVLCNRYLHSGIAYAMAQGIDRRWTVDQQAGLPSPDAVVYLDLSASDAEGACGVRRRAVRAQRLSPARVARV